MDAANYEHHILQLNSGMETQINDQVSVHFQSLKWIRIFLIFQKCDLKKPTKCIQNTDIKNASK
jgi:hypothetical protein